MLSHKGTVRIETERLSLRAFEPFDAQDMFCNWASGVRFMMIRAFITGRLCSGKLRV